MTTRKKALVTGGATGIGRSAVLALAKAGYDVAINYGSSAKAAKATALEAEQLGAQTLCLQCDVSDEAGVRQMMKTIEEKFGHLDALINNAGTTSKWKVKDLESLDLDEWDRTFAVNVRGLFQVTRAAVPLHKKGTAPSIVNTASIVGIRPGPQPLPYAASKAAVVNMTKTLAWNLGPEIRVNAVAPGWMEGAVPFFSSGTAARVTWNRPRTLTAKVRSHSARSRLSRSLTFHLAVVPALLTSASRWPKASSICFIIWRTAGSSDTSHCSSRVWAPSACASTASACAALALEA
ncbi:MAG: family oxidoreductase [Polaromonas sp.]|nr:family oxidoreductase [Polaromonas sp.]